jgi:glycosyltransferase involved in cell wall biosynthesis
MKIAFAHSYTLRIPRGTEKVFILLANELAKTGHDVTHLTRRTKKRKNVVTISPKVKVKEIPTFKYYESLTTIPFYFYEFLKGKYDIVVIAFAKYGEGIPLWLASKLIKTKYFVRFAYSLEFQPYRYKEFDFPPIGKDASGLIAVSQAIAKGVETHFGRPCNILPQAVESESFKPVKEKSLIRESLGIPKDAKLILSVSAIEERKGIQHAIKILSESIKYDSKFLLCVVGDGPYLDELKRLSSKNGLENNIRFFGQRDDIVKFYQAADLFAIFSELEPNPNTLYEALSTGIPVITSKTGCFPEIIKENWGTMVDPKNMKSTRHLILDLMSNKDRLKEMGAAGRDYVIENHTWGKMAEEFLKILMDSE